MGNRIIKESIRTSRSVNSLSDFLFRFWIYLITYVDDYGRGSADPQLLKGFVFPRKDGITEHQITEALEALASKGMIHLYESDGELFFCFPKWEEHQQIRAKKSKFPAPDGIGNHMKSDEIKCPRNPIQSNANTNTNPNAPAHAQEDKNSFGKVMSFYMDKINPTPSRISIDSLKAFTTTLGADVILHAFGIALDEKKTSWSYINAILARYERDGLTNMQAVLEEEQRHKAKKEPVEAKNEPKKQEHSIDLLNDIVEYPYGSGQYRPRWEVPEDDSGV